MTDAVLGALVEPTASFILPPALAAAVLAAWAAVACVVVVVGALRGHEVDPQDAFNDGFAGRITWRHTLVLTVAAVVEEAVMGFVLRPALGVWPATVVFGVVHALGLAASAPVVTGRRSRDLLQGWFMIPTVLGYFLSCVWLGYGFCGAALAHVSFNLVGLGRLELSRWIADRRAPVVVTGCVGVDVVGAGFNAADGNLAIGGFGVADRIFPPVPHIPPIDLEP